MTKLVRKPLKETLTHLLLGVLKSVLLSYLSVDPWCQNVKVFKVWQFSFSQSTFYALQTSVPPPPQNLKFMLALTVLTYLLSFNGSPFFSPNLNSFIIVLGLSFLKISSFKLSLLPAMQVCRWPFPRTVLQNHYFHVCFSSFKSNVSAELLPHLTQ